jgi:hypothetical protein
MRRRRKKGRTENYKLKPNCQIKFDSTGSQQAVTRGKQLAKMYGYALFDGNKL